MTNNKNAKDKRKSRAKGRRRNRTMALRLAFIIAFTLIVICFAMWAAVNKNEAEAELKPETMVLATVTYSPPAKLQNEAGEAASHYMTLDVPLSEELQRYTQDVCEKYGVDYPLAIAVMYQESRFQNEVTSRTGDYGIMQINKGNHEWLESELGITDWLDPRQNILAGIYVLSQFDYEDLHKILMSYNCGPTGAKRLWESGIYSTAYSRAVVEIRDELEVMSLE